MQHHYMAQGQDVYIFIMQPPKIIAKLTAILYIAVSIKHMAVDRLQKTQRGLYTVNSLAQKMMSITVTFMTSVNSVSVIVM